MTINHPYLGEITVDIDIWRNDWTVEDIQANPTALFVFNDDFHRNGTNTSAAIRQEPNTLGIVTAWRFDTTYKSKFSDKHTKMNLAAMEQDILNILAVAHVDKMTICMSDQGYGINSERLQTEASETFAGLNGLLKDYFGYDNNGGLY